MIGLCVESNMPLDCEGLGGTIQQVQNILGKILDIVESSLNAFNFTVRLIRPGSAMVREMN